MKKTKNQFGIATVVILVIAGLMFLVVAYFGLRGFNNFNSPSPLPSPSPKISTTSSSTSSDERKALYDKYHEQIKAELHLTEQQFQILRQHSAN